MKMSDLLADAVAAGVLPPDAADAANRHLARREEKHETPWYLHALIAVGAWLAAAFFLGFAGAIFGGLIFDKDGVAIVIGVLLLGGVVSVRRAAKGAFFRQICLALSVSAHGLIFAGIFKVDQRAWDYGLVPLAAVVLAAVLYELYADTLHRFLSCTSALVMATLWLEYEQPHLFHRGIGEAALLAHLAALGWVFMGAATPVRFRALGYALAVSMLVFALPHFATWRLTLNAALVAWNAKLILSFSLLALLRWIAGPPRRVPAWFIGAPALLLVGVTTTPGVLAGLLLLGLGLALQERVLASLGMVFLPLFLAFYYYQLDLTLLQKAITLAASGVTLLIVRAVVQRLPAPTPPTP